MLQARNQMSPAPSHSTLHGTRHCHLISLATQQCQLTNSFSTHANTTQSHRKAANIELENCKIQMFATEVRGNYLDPKICIEETELYM